MEELGDSELICPSNKERDVAFTLASDDKVVALQPLIKIETSDNCLSQQTPTETVLSTATKVAKSGHELGDSEPSQE